MNILILHGWGSSFKKWTEVKQILENKGYKVFVPDLPGFGENPPPEKAWSIDDYVDWLKGYCEKQNLSQIFLLGHSFGGAIAVKFVLKYPQLVKKLFLVAPALIRKKTLKKELVKKIAPIFSFLPKKVKKIIYHKILKSNYPSEPGVMREIYLKIVTEDLLEILPQIQIPTIIIWGKKDRIKSIKEGYLINNKIKNSKLEIIPDADHSPYRETPEKFIEIIIKNL